ncbi:hypothetical protein JCM10207_004773 [Rhodosporidiobolus poonsookiae]
MPKPKREKRESDHGSVKEELNDDESYILRLPDELVVQIAAFYNPSIPFELGHFVLASGFSRNGRDELRSLAATCKRFARILRPTIYRNLVFQDDKRRSRTVHLYKAKEIHEHVKELYWQPSYLYNDMSPVFLPLLKNLQYLVLAFLPQSVPDEYISDDYAGVTTLRASFTDALAQLPQLEALEIPFWESAESPEFRFCEVLPNLTSVSIGDWQQWECFDGIKESKITTVKWLIDPDIDLADGLVEGFVENMMPQAKMLQFAAHTGWGRTDLPDTLPQAMKKASWFKDMAERPLESMILHGFNPITSYKKEWATLLPSFLSLLAPIPNLKYLSFLDVPSLRNDDRYPLDWDEANKLERVETMQISLATDEIIKEKLDEDGGHGSQQEEHNTSSNEAEDEGEREELSERILPEDIYMLLGICPNVKHLTLSNFLRCKKPSAHSDRRSDAGVDGAPDEATDCFAEKQFQPAARDFVRELGLYDRFQNLEQIVFRDVDAELSVRFRRMQENRDEHEEESGWVEELRRLY